MSDVQDCWLSTSGHKEMLLSSGSEQDDEAVNTLKPKANVSQSQSLNLRPNVPVFVDILKSRSQAPLLVPKKQTELLQTDSMSRTSNDKYQSIGNSDAAFTKIHLEDMRNISESDDVNVTRSVTNFAGCRFNKLVAHVPGQSFSSGCNILIDRIKSNIESEMSAQPIESKTSEQHKVCTTGVKHSSTGIELSHIASSSDNETLSDGEDSQTQIPTALLAALNKRLYPVILQTYKEYASTFGKEDLLTQQAKTKLIAMSNWLEGPAYNTSKIL